MLTPKAICSGEVWNQMIDHSTSETLDEFMTRLTPELHTYVQGSLGIMTRMVKNRTRVVVVLTTLCVGCAGFRDSRLESHRQVLAVTYRDQTRPMTERMAAFDDLLDTFTSGTPESTLDRFVGWPVADTKSRISGYVRDDGVFVPG